MAGQIKNARSNHLKEIKRQCVGHFHNENKTGSQRFKPINLLRIRKIMPTLSKSAGSRGKWASHYKLFEFY